MFPTAGSHIYRNGMGEVTGWDTDYGYEPEYCDICGGGHPEINCPNDSYGEPDEDEEDDPDCETDEEM